MKINKVYKNALCFIMGYLFAMETYVMLVLSMNFCKLLTIGLPILNLENLQQSYVLFDVM